eukprot:1371645-Pyramimonas_sp.AAC.1
MNHLPVPKGVGDRPSNRLDTKADLSPAGETKGTKAVGRANAAGTGAAPVRGVQIGPSCALQVEDMPGVHRVSDALETSPLEAFLLDSD